MKKFSKIWIFALLLSMSTVFLGSAEETVTEPVTETVAEQEVIAEEVTEEAEEEQRIVYGRVEEILAELRGQGAQMDEVQINDETSKFAREFLEMLNSDLILPGEGEEVTRGDFVKALVTLVYPGTEYNSGTSFEDIEEDSEYAGYAEFALQAGIISPSAQFSPDRPVTYAEAYKMAICAIGYGIKAKAAGGWPTGYISLAHQLKISKNISGESGDTLKGNDAVVILYRMATADMMFQMQFGDKITYEVFDEKSVITEYYDVHEVEGILNANEDTELLSVKGATKKGTVKIDDTTYFCNDDKGLLGCNVLAYYKGNEETNTLVFLKREDTEVYEMFAEYITVKGSKIIYDDGETKEEYNLASTYNYIYNGKAKLITVETPEECLGINGALLRIVDADDDDRYETVFVDDFKYIHVSAADIYEKVIYDKVTKDNMLDLSHEDCKYEFYKYADEMWQTASWDDISEGVLLAAAVSEDGLYARIYICENVAEGTITSTAFDQHEIYIDKTYYALHPYFIENYRKEDAMGNEYYATVLGNEYRFMIGIDGRIVLCDMQSATDDYMYGWILKVAETGSIGSEVQVKMFTQNGKMIVYTLAEKVLIDGTNKSVSEAKEFIEKRGNSEDTYLDRFIRYTIDGNNQITKIDTSVDASNENIDYLDETNREPDNQLMKYTFANTLNYRVNGNMFGAQFNISKTVCFMIPPFGSEDAKKDESYSLMYDGYYQNNYAYNATTKLIVYDLNLSGSAGAMINLVAGTVTDAASIPEDSLQAVIEKVVQSADDEGNKYYEAKVWTSTGYMSYYFEMDMEYSVKPHDLNPGDIIRVSADSSNIVTAVARDFDFEKFSVDSSMVFTNRNGLYINKYLLAIPYTVQDGYAIMLGGTVSDGKYVFGGDYSINNMYNLRMATIAVINAERSASTGKVISASVSNDPKAVMRDYKTAGDSADVVLTCLRYIDAVQYYAYRIKYVD